MYSVSGTFLTKIKQASRIIKAKVEINSTTLTEVDIVDFGIESSVGADDIPSIGSVTSNKLTLNLIKSANIPAVLIGVPIKPSVAIDIGGGVYEWVPMGVFYAINGDVTVNDKTITITCFDKLSSYDDITYTSALTYPASVQSVLTEIGTNFGVTFETQTLPSVNIPYKLEGTLRIVLSQIALFISTNCTMNRLGQVKFIFTSASGFSLDGNNYINFNLNAPNMAKISQLSVVKTDETSLHSGDSTGLNLEYETDIVVDQTSLNTIFNRIYPLNFYSYNLDLQGMPHLDVGDTFTFTDKDNVIRTLIIVNNKFKYSGGFTSTFSVQAPQEPSKTTTVTSGSTLAQAVDKIYTNMASSIENATNLITGNSGGYVITVMDSLTGKPKELVIADTDDINTATKVWRWNNAGLGYSSTGYNGTYGTAITQDGQIVANYITTGELSADRINGGTLTLGGSVNTDGKFLVKDASGNTLVGADVSGLAVYDNTFKITSGHLEFNPDGTIKYGSYEAVTTFGAWELSHTYSNSTSSRTSSYSLSSEGLDLKFTYGFDAVFQKIWIGLGDTLVEKDASISAFKVQGGLRFKDYTETTEAYIIDINSSTKAVSFGGHVYTGTGCNIYAGADINLDVSGGEKHVRSHDTGHDWGLFFSTNGFGGYDWTSSRSVFSYDKTLNRFNITPTTYINGALGVVGGGIEIGRTDNVASTPYLDFHSGATSIDYDVRLIASGGTGTLGAGILNVLCSNFQINGNNVVDIADFVSSLGTSGYHKFPSGMIVQWGVVSSVASGTLTAVNLPLTFPNAIYNGVGSMNGGALATDGKVYGVSVNLNSTSQIAVLHSHGSARNISWIAFGK